MNIRTRLAVLAASSATLLSAFPPPAFAQTVSGELRVGNSFPALAGGFQENSTVASNGSTFLVVWGDARGDDPNRHDIYGARVTAAGKVLDPGGIRISAHPWEENSPEVAWTGSSYLVVWTDGRNGNADIYGTRVRARDGRVFDPKGLPIATGPSDETKPRLERGGSQLLAVWNDSPPYQDGRPTRPTSVDVSGTRLNAQGSPIDTTRISVSQAQESQDVGDIAWNGTDWLVVWSDSRAARARDVYAARVSSAGVVHDPDGLLIATAPKTRFDPVVAWAGSRFFAAWADTRASSAPDIYGTAIMRNGTSLSRAGRRIAAARGYQSEPTISSLGSSFLLGWSDSRNGKPRYQDIYGTVVTTSGAIATPGGAALTRVSGSEMVPSLGWNGSRFLLTWTDFREGTFRTTPNVFGTAVDHSGSVVHPSGFSISRGINIQEAPAIAWNGSIYLAVWSDTRNATRRGSDIYGARFTAGGRLLDPAGILISGAPDGQLQPVVAWGGSAFLVAWTDYRNQARGPNIFGARVTASGRVLDPSGIALSRAEEYQYQYGPALAWGGSRWLVAWTHASCPDELGLCDDVYATQVSASGSVLYPSGIAVSRTRFVERGPSVAWSGTSFLIAWTDCRDDKDHCDFFSGEGPYDVNVYGARLTPAGRVLDPRGLPITTAPGGQGGASVAWGGSSYLVAWGDSRNVAPASSGDPLPIPTPSSSSPSSGNDIYGVRIARSGQRLDPADLAISSAMGDQGSVQLTWNGGEYLAVWEDLRRGSAQRDVFGARISSAGSVLDPDGFVVAASSVNERSPRTSRGQTGRNAVVYQRLASGADRSFLRLVQD